MFYKKLKIKRERDKNINVLIQHTDYVYGFAFRYCGNKNIANDLVQETFLIAYRKFDQLRDHSKCKFWLISILRNIFYRECEKNKRYNYADIDNYEERIPDLSVNSEKNIMNDDLLQKVLNKVEEKYKTPLLMYFMSELSYKEIAEELNMPIGTVMSRISRAKNFLRIELEKLDSEKNNNKDKVEKEECLVVNIKSG